MLPRCAELEFALALGHGRGESALLVAEELALDERFRDGGAVDLHERATRPSALEVDGAGHQLLACAVLPEDEDAGVGIRALVDDAPDLFHRLAFADHAVLDEKRVF